MGRKSLPKSERLRTSQEFEAVLRKGDARAGRLLVLFRLPSEGERRVGFATTRRVPSAVLRNRAKRLMREAYRSLRADVEERGVRVVFLARGDASGLTLEGVRAEMVDLLTAAGVWRG
jgi:ribonuclease P protein component